MECKNNDVRRMDVIPPLVIRGFGQTPPLSCAFSMGSSSKIPLGQGVKALKQRSRILTPVANVSIVSMVVTSPCVVLYIIYTVASSSPIWNILPP